MKRNRESKSRIKIIQQRHMNKQQQKMLEATINEHNLTFTYYYKLINLDKESLHKLIGEIIAKSVQDFGVFQGVFDNYEFKWNDNKPCWIGVDFGGV